ncbi:MAG: TetR/AcrR family transcriptional regulator [Acidimicrobiales bacterium]
MRELRLNEEWDPMGRPRLTEVRRAHILETAVRVISARGLADTSMALVAAEAGMSPALVFYYFGTKSKLLAETLLFAEERFYRRVTDELETLDTPPDKLLRLLELACLVGSESGSDVWDDWILWVESWARALRDDELASQREELDRRWLDTICSIVSEGRLTGDFRAGEPEEVSRLFAGLIDGLALQVLLRDPGFSSTRAFEICVRVGSSELDCDLGLHLARYQAADRARSTASGHRGVAQDRPTRRAPTQHDSATTDEVHSSGHLAII